MAMLILTQHTCNEWAHSTGLIHAFFGLGNFAVPFFFTCSGFLFFSKLNMLNWKEQKNYYKQWSMRIGKMYLIWSIIYFCFVLTMWISNGFTLEKIINYLHRVFVFSTYSTIWFLPALWVGVSICYWLKQHVSKRAINVSALATVIFCSLFILEAFCISHYKLSSATDMGFFMCFAIFFMINTLIKIDITQKPIWRHCRNLSMLIFLGQRLFLSAIPSILPICVKDTIITWSQPYIYILFITLTLGFSFIVEQLSSKYRFLKNLW